ncbi:hypothetical protein FRC04_009309 [Tulasnella sp. 424]|nr:hypothetical protein FRC04_009309 [Tulasnella sp. 424]
MNHEFSFNVNVSQLPCGPNDALYFSEMDADDGMSKYPTNKTCAKNGTGYCDSQRPRNLKFIAGQANNIDWVGTSAKSVIGNCISCYKEMDIWEANSISAAYTLHPCDIAGLYWCRGDHDFYGPSKTVDTTKKFTVVTQFINDSGTASGNLSETLCPSKNGVVIANFVHKIAAVPVVNSIIEAYCDAQKSGFGDTTSFQNHGGLVDMGKSLARGGVLVLSVWDDYAVNMLLLDSTYPTDCTKDGCFRGTCAITSGVPSDVESSASNVYVVYSNIRFGDIGSTYSGTSSSTTTNSSASTTSKSSSSTTTKSSASFITTTTTTTTTSSANGATQTHYGQCGSLYCT